MPVEIRELIIRAVTTSDSETNINGSATLFRSDRGREEDVQECVKQVLRILKKEKER